MLRTTFPTRLGAAALLIAASGALAAQEATPVRMIVTVESRQGAEIPAVAKPDVLVFQHKQRLTVTRWERYTPENPALELFILIDDASNTSIASQYEDLREFILQQPSGTRVGIGYMRNGMVRTEQPLTHDRAHAIKHLRLPMTSGGASNPYLSLSELIRDWPETAARREVLLITPGVAAFELGGEGYRNPPGPASALVTCATAWCAQSSR